MLTRDRGFGAYGDAGTVDTAALDGKLAEIRGALTAALRQYGVQSVAQAQDVLYGSHVAIALELVSDSLDLLAGDLYQAVLGQHVFPLDTGGSADPAAALESWRTIAGDAQTTLSGTLGYMAKWGPMPAIKYAANQTFNPLNWPWYVQAAAALVIYTYVRPVLGLLPSRRK